MSSPTNAALSDCFILVRVTLEIIFSVCVWYVFGVFLVFLVCFWNVFGVFLVCKLRGEMGEGGGGSGWWVAGEPGGAAHAALPLDIE